MCIVFDMYGVYMCDVCVCRYVVCGLYVCGVYGMWYLCVYVYGVWTVHGVCSVHMCDMVCMCPMYVCGVYMLCMCVVSVGVYVVCI